MSKKEAHEVVGLASYRSGHPVASSYDRRPATTTTTPAFQLAIINKVWPWRAFSAGGKRCAPPSGPLCKQFSALPSPWLRRSSKRGFANGNATWMAMFAGARRLPRRAVKMDGSRTSGTRQGPARRLSHQVGWVLCDTAFYERSISYRPDSKQSSKPDIPFFMGSLAEKKIKALQPAQLILSGRDRNLQLERRER